MPQHALAQHLKIDELASRRSVFSSTLPQHKAPQQQAAPLQRCTRPCTHATPFTPVHPRQCNHDTAATATQPLAALRPLAATALLPRHCSHLQPLRCTDLQPLRCNRAQSRAPTALQPLAATCTHCTPPSVSFSARRWHTSSAERFVLTLPQFSNILAKTRQ